jgi:hypothetical protein
MDINKLLYNLEQFYLSIKNETGLKSWQLVIIAIASFFIFIKLFNYLQKILIKIRMNRKPRRSNLIGANLSDKYKNEHSHKKHRNKQAVHISEDDDEQQSWGQTTKDWRKLREKIRHLQHDIGKHEKIEKHLKEEISELKITNKKLQSEIDKRIQTEDTLHQQINELTTTAIIQNQDEEPIQEEVEPSPSDTEESGNNPLDIKELKVIADLVKQLQTRSKQRQSE